MNQIRVRIDGFELRLSHQSGKDYELGAPQAINLPQIRELQKRGTVHGRVLDDEVFGHYVRQKPPLVGCVEPKGWHTEQLQSDHF